MDIKRYIFLFTFNFSFTLALTFALYLHFIAAIVCGLIAAIAAYMYLKNILNY